MTKKRDMTDGEYDIYKKIHNDEHPPQVEESKIRREKSSAAQYRRKHHTQNKERLNEITHPDDIENWDDDQALADFEFIAEREVRNARAHKQRLTRLARRQRQEAAEQDHSD